MKNTFTKLVLVLSLIITSTTKAQLSAGFFTVGTATDNAATITNTWNTPPTGGQLASLIGVPQGQTSSGLRLTNFGFTIPAGAIILGVEAQLSFSLTGGAGKDSVIRLSLNNNEIGNNLGGTHTFTPILQTYTYGTSNSTWGTSLTPADVNSPTFGFTCRLKSVGNTSPLYAFIEKSQLQLAKMKVYFDNATGIIESQTASVKLYAYNKSIYLKESVPENSELYVFNLLGEKVYQTTIEPGQTQIQIEELPMGIYVYKLKTGKTEFSQKIKID